MSNETDVEAMIAHAVERFGRLDCLINNAGSGSGYTEIEKVNLGQFDEVIAVHVRGALAGMKYSVPVMARQKTGSIINVASVNGSRAGLGGHYYSAAKAALIHLMRCAAVELGENGIRVNSISPRPIATGAFGKSAGLDPDRADTTVDLAKAAIAAVVLSRYQPLPKVGTVDDIAQTALFLASDASRLVTGHDLVVDGSKSAGWARHSGLLGIESDGSVRDQHKVFRHFIAKYRNGRRLASFQSVRTGLRHHHL